MAWKKLEEPSESVLREMSGSGVTNALFMLNKAMGGTNEEGQPTAAAFNKIGLSLASLKKMNAIEQFRAISQGLAKLPDAATRAKVASEMFGKGARDMMAVLNDPKGFSQSIAASTEYAKTMQENAGAFEEVEKSVEEVKMKVEEFYAGVASGLAPILEKVLGYIKKIDFAKWGRDIGQAVAIIGEAFKEGKVTEILRLGLVLAFKDAGNTLTGIVVGIGAGLSAVFTRVPKLLSDAFSMLTNASFWKGIGELLLGAFMSISAQLTKLFFNIADALGNRLADILSKVPLMKDAAEDIRKAMNAGNDRLQGGLDKSVAQGNAMTSAGTTDVAGAAAPLTTDFSSTIKASIASAILAFAGKQGTPPEAKKLADLIASLAAKVAPAAGAAPADGSQKTPGATSGLSIKNTDNADRLAKLGLFIGGAPQTPGIGEARRTATATEESRKLLTKIVQWGPNKYQNDPVYA